MIPRPRGARKSSICCGSEQWGATARRGCGHWGLPMIIFFNRSFLLTITPQEILALRAKWKPQFSEWLLTHNHKKLRTDVIVRDLKRMDNYPDTAEGKGISAWFRSAVIDTYEKGIMLGLGFGTYEYWIEIAAALSRELQVY